jgi:Zn-dependent alcohol dehydrogenase
VRIGAVGVCHTDLSWADGLFGRTFPGVAGHEIAGIVEAVGADVGRAAVGDRVVVSVVRHCGTCPRCCSGEPVLCLRRDERPERYRRNGDRLEQVFGTGGFAEATVVHASAVQPIPAAVSLVAAAALGCAGVTGYGAVVRIARVERGAEVAVVGCGGVGLAAVAAARAAGAARVVGADLDAARQAEALAFGATEAVDRAEGAFDVVVEAAGTPEAVREALALVRPGGTVVATGLPAAGTELGIDLFDLVVGQKHLHGCNMGDVVPDEDVPALFELVDLGLLPIERFASATFALADTAAAFAYARTRRGVRAVVVPDGAPI